MKKMSALLAIVAAAGAALSAQQISLGSLFDRYTVNPKWAQLPEGQPWGASTSSVAADGKGSVYVLVRTPPYVRVFTTDGKPVRSWGDKGLVALAHSVHVDPDGSLWITDPDSQVVHKFSQDGKLLMTLGRKGVHGDDTSKDAFNEPNSVVIAPNGDIFVSDGYGSSRVVQFRKDGTFVRIFGGRKGNAPGELQVPHGVAVDPQGRVIVADSDNKRLSIFDKDGKFLKTIAAPSRGGLIAAADGTLYVSDVNAGTVVVIRNDQIADVIKVDGRPHGLGVDPATGDIYTSSTLGNQWNVTKASPKAPAVPGQRPRPTP